MLVASIGFAATVPLQERLVELTPAATRGQVQGVESAGRIGWQGVGAVLGGSLALLVPPATAIGALAAASLLVTIATRPFVDRAHTTTTPATVGESNAVSRA